MATGTSGAVFFLGTRAHYQVLQQPDTSVYNMDNGNTSTEYPSTEKYQEMWNDDNIGEKSSKYLPNDCTNWMSCRREKNDNSPDSGTLSPGNGNFGVSRRFKKRFHDGSNEKILNENDEIIDLEPAMLNNLTYRDSVKSKTSDSGKCVSLKNLLSNLKSRRKKKLSFEDLDFLGNLENVLNMCTYKDSCRCLDCQSRYFECDETESDCSSSDYDYEDDDDDDNILHLAIDNPIQSTSKESSESLYDSNEEVFVDSPPQDTVSTDLLIEKPPEKMSVSSEESLLRSEYEEALPLEMAAGTPVVLDYLLNHPLSCTIQ